MTQYTTPQFTVDSHGAYLTKLVDSAGSPILFERTTIGDKRRGGAHVCFPYFGPDAAGVKPQHGLGRDVEWEVEVLSDNEITCVYEQRDDYHFTGLSARILYSLDEAENRFITSLLVSNKSSLNGPLSTTPGFHPYFAVDPHDVRLDGKHIDLADYEPFKEFPNTEIMAVESAGRVITVQSRNLQHMIVWTDMRGDYLCVEPTLRGNAFNSIKTGENLVQPASVETYSYTISWS